MEVTKEKFDAFIVWLKNDGLRPRTSERLWKKEILKNLKNDEPRTIANYIDFMKDFNRKKSPKKEVSHLEIDDFDYSILVGQFAQPSKGNKMIRRYIDSGSFLHLFYDDETDAIVDKKEIQKKFKSIMCA